MADQPVLDSDVLVDYLRRRGPGKALVESLEPSGYWVTAVTALELALGASYERDPEPVNNVISAPCLSLSRSAGLRAGKLLASLRARGRGIEIRDAMQAGICLDAGLLLVTRNVRHFERVPDLRVVHPSDWPLDGEQG